MRSISEIVSMNNGFDVIEEQVRVCLASAGLLERIKLIESLKEICNGLSKSV